METRTHSPYAQFNLFKSEEFNKSLAVVEEEELEQRSREEERRRVFFVVILDARRVLSNSRVYDILSCARARARARRRTFFLMPFRVLSINYKKYSYKNFILRCVRVRVLFIEDLGF